ncbi:MAG: hypothetical protein AAF363_20410 [Bacteroidota bacterium]
MVINKIAVCIVCLFMVISSGVNAQGEQDEQRIRDFKMRLNEGVRYTSDREIKLEIRPTKLRMGLISKMKISFTSDFRSVSWTDAERDATITLPAGDGEKTVYVQLRDEAGNDSNIESSKIILDTQPPTAGNIVINEGEKVTNSKFGKVRLSIGAKGAYKMQLSNTSNFSEARWEKFTDKRNWILNTDGDGEKTVFIRFGDEANNISSIFQDDIILDTTPPEGSIMVNEGERFTTERDIKINIMSADTDVAQVRIVDGTNDEIRPFGSNSREPNLYDWTLDTLEGKKAIRVYFRDNAGNISPKPAVDEIILDTKPPEKPFIAINRGAKYATDPEGQVNISIRTRETPTGYTVRLSNDESFKTFEDLKYKAEVPGWKLDAKSDGYKTVYAKFIDQAGNVSEVGKASTSLDRKYPEAKSIKINDDAEWSHKPVVDLKIDVLGADMMQISNDSSFKTSTRWIPFQSEIKGWILTGEEGVNMVYARFRDMAGNSTTVLTDGIKLDTKPPSGRIVINKGENVVTDKEGKVVLNIIYNSYASEMQISNDSLFKTAKWQPATKEVLGWKLAGEEDGPRIVYAKFRDEAGQISAIARDRVLLDRTPPKDVQIALNKNAKYCTDDNKKVMVFFKALGAKEMKVGSSEDLSALEWIPVQATYEYTLEGEDGMKTVYAQFRDAFGNESGVVKDDIILDRTPPEPRLFVIDEGAEWTNNQDKKVALKMRADDAYQMRVDFNPDFKNSEWQKYSTSLSDYVLNGEDGTKKLYIIFRDDAGNISRALDASIKLKREF